MIGGRSFVPTIPNLREAPPSMQFFTEASNEAAQGFTFDPLTIFMLVILVVLIIFMVRNSRKRKAQTEELAQKMVPGANVMTNFGLFGELIDIDEERNEAHIEVSPGTVLRVHRTTLSRVVDDEPAEQTTDDHDDVTDGTDTESGDGPIERL